MVETANKNHDINLDDLKPKVVSITPINGASGVSITDSTLEIEFSEPVKTTTGSITVTGPSIPDILEDVPASWTDNKKVTFDLPILNESTQYTVTISDFNDTYDNKMLDHTTTFRTEDILPTVVSVTPTGNVSTRTNKLAIEFSEPMDTTVSGTIELLDENTGLPVTAIHTFESWTEGDTKVTYDLSGLRDSQTYKIKFQISWIKPEMKWLLMIQTHLRQKHRKAADSERQKLSAIRCQKNLKNQPLPKKNPTITETKILEAMRTTTKIRMRTKIQMKE